MSLKTAIENAKARVSAAFDAVEAKGGTKPSVANLAALPSAIDSIPSGGVYVVPADANVSFINSRFKIFDGNNIDVSNCEYLEQSFANCYAAKVIDIHTWNTEKCSSFYGIFSSCGSQTTDGVELYLQAFDLSRAANVPNFGYSKIKTIRVGSKWNKGVNLSTVTMGHDCIVQFFEDLPTIPTGTQTITIGSAKLALLSDAEKAIATSKGWTLA